MEFRKITIEDKALIDSYMAKYPCYGSTYSMAYLKCWSYFSFDEMEIAYDDTALVLRFPHGGHMNYMAELCDKDRFPRLVDELLAISDHAKIVQLESDYLDLLDKDKYSIMNFVDFDEYLYDPSDLINLAGKRYHGKRNHIKRFMNNYEYEFRDYVKEDRQAVMALFEDWQEEKGIEIDSEENTINIMLDNMEAFGLIGGVILIDGKIVAFTLGEITASNVGIVHIEKASTDYEGLYPAINKLFAEKYFKNVTYINRQEDLGIEGLRKAKRSYYPVRMSEKSSLTRIK